MIAEKISIVTVTYESAPVVEQLLKSVDNLCPVIVVDNSSVDAMETERIAARYSATLVKNTINIGFGSACNLGFGITDTEYVLFANPDVRLREDTLEKLVAGFEMYPDCAAANPRIFDELNRPCFKGRSVLLKPSDWVDEPFNNQKVPVLSGAALCVRRSAFLEIGGFDSNIFLYHEDDDLSIRLRQAGGVLMYLRAASVVHLGGEGSAQTQSTAWRKGWSMGRSRVYAARKHGMPFGVFRAMVSAIGHMVNPEMLWSPARWTKQGAFLLGTFYEMLVGIQPFSDNKNPLIKS